MTPKQLTDLLLELVEHRIGQVSVKLLAQRGARWIADPEVNGVYGLKVDNDCAVILYPADNDFEVADWYDEFCHSPLFATIGL